MLRPIPDVAPRNTAVRFLGRDSGRADWLDFLMVLIATILDDCNH